MKHKQLFGTLLVCTLLLGCSFVPAAAADTSANNSVVLRVSGRLNHRLPANLITPITQSFTLEAGDIIKYDCTYTPKSASLDFGYIDSNNVFHYLNCTSGSIDQSFEVGQSGQYTQAIRNNASYAVTVTGTVKY